MLDVKTVSSILVFVDMIDIHIHKRILFITKKLYEKKSYEMNTIFSFVVVGGVLFCH